jgi:chromosome partitioning protein
MSMKRIVVANQKGGVGKTTTAINIAVVLARSHRVLAVDMDAQFALTRQLGITPGATTLVEVLSGRAPTRAAIVHLDVLGLAVLPARRDLAEVEQALVTQAGREWFLSQALDEVADSFDIAVIDTPPNLAQLTVNALAIADLVLAPINLEDEGAAQGLVELQARMGELERVRRLARLPAKPPLLPFYNRSSQRADNETRLSAQAITQALEGLGMRAARTRIPDRVVVQHAAIARVPVVAYRPDNIASTSFARLADDVLTEAA